jgi:hypothetical protein
MTAYAVAEGDIAVHDKALTASTVDTVTFHDTPRFVEIVTDGTAAIYVTVDGSVPTVSGPNTYKLPASASLRVIPHAHAGQPVKLISTGTPTYSVTVA